MILPFADLVLLTATSSLAVVFGVILAILFLGEKLNARYDIPTVILILSGCILTIAFADRKEQMFTKEMVVERLTSPDVIIYIMIALTSYVVTYIAFKT